MARKFTLTFIPCSPAPANGYNVLWRQYGSGDPYTDAGNFTTSPIVITDPDGDPDTEYEGILRSDCGNGEFGSEIPFSSFVCCVPTDVSAEAVVIAEEYDRIITQRIVAYAPETLVNNYLFVDVSLFVPGTDYYVDWGDGTVENIVLPPFTGIASYFSHTYSLPGTYTTRIFYKANDVTTVGYGNAGVAYDSDYFTHTDNCISLKAVSIYDVLDINNHIPPAASLINNFSLLGSENSTMTIANLSGINGNVVTLNISKFPEMTTITNYPANATSFTITQCPAMVDLDSGGSSPAFIDFGVGPNVPITTYFPLDLSACNNLGFISSLTSSQVDTILEALDANGLSSGYCGLAGQSPPAPPGGGGATAKANLLSKGWAVATD